MKTAQDFIEFFEKIPDGKWYVGHYYDRFDPSCKCAIGHLSYDDNGDFIIGSFSSRAALTKILDANAAHINDGINKYIHLGSTPKQRIINALKQVRDAT